MASKNSRGKGRSRREETYPNRWRRKSVDDDDSHDDADGDDNDSSRCCRGEIPSGDNRNMMME